MSLMNDRWIRHMANKYGMISPYIDKQEGEGVISYGPSSFGYDVRAGYTWKIFTDVLGAIVDPKNQDERAYHTIKCLDELDDVGTPCEPVIIPPNSYALTHTLEYFDLPRNVTCVCIGKSTYARCGIHVNVTPLEAGWRGQVTVEISNATRLPVKVYPGEGIMQVLFFTGDDPDVCYADRKGKYQNQEGITLAKVLKKERPEMGEDAKAFAAIDAAMEYGAAHKTKRPKLSGKSPKKRSVRTR